MKLSPLRITAVYVLVSVLWITLSDKVLFGYPDVTAANELHTVSTLKGVIFVTVTALLLWLLMRIKFKHLSESERQYRYMYEGNKLPMWIYDLQTLKFVSVNDAAIEHYGYSREQFLQMTIMDIRPPSDKEKVLDGLKSVSKNLKHSSNWVHYKADGTPIFVDISSQQILFNNKLKVMVTAQDVTTKVYFEQKLKLVNEDLQEQKGRLTETQQIAKIGGWDFYFENKHLAWSDEMYVITETDPADPTIELYQHFLNLIHKEDRDALIAAVRASIQRGKPVDMTHRIALISGRVLFVRQLVHIEYRPNGKPHRLVGSMQDITEFKQLELERNSYFLGLENTLESISEGFYALNKELVFVKINKKFEMETGLTASQVIGKKLEDIFPGVERRITYQQLVTVLREKVPVNFEVCWENFNRWFALSAYPTEEGLAVYFRDITEEKKKDAQLQEALDRYGIVSKATQDVIYDHNFELHTITFNTNLHLLIGQNAQNHNNSISWWLSLIHPDDLEVVLQSQKEVNQKRETRWQCQHRIRFNDSYKYVYAQGYFVYNAAGKPVRMIGSIRDVDELHRSNEENKRLASIITQVNNMIVVLDGNHEIAWANKAFEEYTGYTFEEMLGKCVADLVGGDKLSAIDAANMNERINRQESFSTDLQHFLKDGSTQWVNVAFTPLFNDNEQHTGYIAVHENITVRKEREERIYIQNKILQEISWLSSHAFRKPVASILGLAYLAKDAPVAEKDDIIGMINECAEELDEIVHHITDKISNEFYPGISN
ncbi:PAS domain S-box protein [Mucilaginibacter sp. Bleaf8]|uniref:PAS domain S-box protein n=1 Tax=Mucilaginibacter sp. Bleaf8 TaxID=2834430 RepID=UPI001BCADDA5|nr:PAS domain S-box protein [Mucilaginibacter sp. Bleaf8]MBS7562882.1 PAS domain S-box protein [Mucilaginibacter sp. Bleaf8]